MTVTPCPSAFTVHDDAGRCIGIVFNGPIGWQHGRDYATRFPSRGAAISALVRAIQVEEDKVEDQLRQRRGGRR